MAGHVQGRGERLRIRTYAYIEATADAIQGTKVRDLERFPVEEQVGIGRWPELLQQGATWLADAALEPLRERLEALAGVGRRELRRAVAAYLLCRLLALFLGAAAGLGALAVMLAWWDGHRVLAAGSLAAVFLVISAGCAAALVRLAARVARPAAHHPVR